jgi:hypothetical protein
MRARTEQENFPDNRRKEKGKLPFAFSQNSSLKKREGKTYWKSKRSISNWQQARF